MSEQTKCKVCGYDKEDREFQNVWHSPIKTAERICIDCYNWMKRVLKEIADGQKRTDGS